VCYTGASNRNIGSEEGKGTYNAFNLKRKGTGFKDCIVKMHFIVSTLTVAMG
jgi:hypothetical protein